MSELLRRIEEVERRLAAVERRIGDQAAADTDGHRAPPNVGVAPPIVIDEMPMARIVASMEAEGAAAARESETAAPRVPPSRAVPPPLPVVKRPAAAALAASPIADGDVALAGSVVIPFSEDKNGKQSAQPPPLTYAPTAPPPDRIREGSLEQTIGLKWAGWIGAVVLVISLGLGIKFAYDNGWFGGMPDGVKLLICWIASLSLIAAGEFVYRRVNKLSAAGFFGAGVASLFIVSYAGHGYFDVYSRNTAFALMAASTVVGALVAMRGRLVSIAVLSLIGGNLAPILLHADEPNLGSFLTYLSMLEIVALVVAWWGGSRRWWMLRTLALATTAFWAAAAISAMSEKIDPRGWPLAFVVAYAGLFQLELIVSALSKHREIQGKRPTTAGGAVFSVLVTLALTSGVIAIFHESADRVQGALVVVIAGTCAALGFSCRDFERAKAGTPQAVSLRAMAISFAVQAAILLVIAVPVAYTGWAVMVGWAALAVAFAIVGAALDLNVPRRAAVYTWGLAALYLAGWVEKHYAAEMARAIMTIMGTAVPQFFAVAVALAAAAHLIAAIVRRGHSDEKARPEFESWAVVIAAAAGVLWAGAAIAALPPLGATAAILAYAWLCAIVDLARPNLRLTWHAAGAIAVAMVKWAVVDVMTARLSPDWSAMTYSVLLNPAMAVGVAIAASMVAIWWLRRDVFFKRDESGAEALGLVWVASTVLLCMTFGLSIEVDRAVQQLAQRSSGVAAMSWSQVELLSLTMLWSAAAAAWAGILRWIRGERGRSTAEAIVTAGSILLAAKYMIVDTLSFRLDEGSPVPVAVGANLQVFAGAVVFALLVLAWFLTRPRDAAQKQSGWRSAIGLLVAVLPLWILSMEIDRWADRQTIAAAWMARHAGWSICWSVYAIVMVIAGFKFRAAAMRYFGLGLFALTLLKVVTVDMSAASTGLRILSFFGLGLLLLATSVVYGKVSPKLLAEENAG